LNGDDGIKDLVFKTHGFNSGLKGINDFVFMTGIGVDNIPGGINPGFQGGKLKLELLFLPFNLFARSYGFGVFGSGLFGFGGRWHNYFLIDGVGLGLGRAEGRFKGLSAGGVIVGSIIRVFGWFWEFARKAKEFVNK